MKAVSRDQSHELIGRIIRTVRWGQLDHDDLQRSIIEGLPEEELGRRLTLFFKNGANFVLKGLSALVVDRTKPFDPAKFVGKGVSIWRGPKGADGLKGEEDQDARSLKLTEVDFSGVLFEHCIKQGENSIKGEEKLTRLLAAGHIRLDAKIGQALYEEKGQATLEWLYNTFGITWFDLPGTVLRGTVGDRYVLYLYRDGGRWHLRCRWLGYDCHVESPSAVLASGPLASEPLVACT